MFSSPAEAPPRGPVVRPLGGLAQAVIVLLCVDAGLGLFSVYADLNSYLAAGNVLSITQQDARHADTAYQVSGFLQICGILATAAVLIPWFYRARVNAEAFSQAVCTRGRGWAIGAWFVPGGNLWLPFRVACEIWDASAQSAPDLSWQHVSRTPVRAWWATWVAAAAVGRVAAVLDRHASLDTLRNAAAAYALADVLSIVAAVMAILFVKKLTRMQQTGPATFSVTPV
ncbi:DUF4328 domain-containing protein [Streptomyces sp. NPDC046197]|uniref:DUF4328 domain-containing protein n=1 Tax=Streptomyces sp. NPDC046197 TaxID=3154337 RepID=UPI0033DD13ED